MRSNKTISRKRNMQTHSVIKNEQHPHFTAAQRWHIAESDFPDIAGLHQIFPSHTLRIRPFTPPHLELSCRQRVLHWSYHLETRSLRLSKFRMFLRKMLTIIDIKWYIRSRPNKVLHITSPERFMYPFCCTWFETKKPTLDRLNAYGQPKQRWTTRVNGV